MKKIITVVSLMVLLTGCGGGGGTVAGTSTSDTTIASNTTAPLESNTQATSTAAIIAAPEFDFASARTIDIQFDVPEARTTEGMLSLCTKYSSESDGTFNINYDSCLVQATLVNGLYQSQMELTNDVNSVIGVIWFADPDLAPVYKEFTLAATAGASARSANANTHPTIVWN
ncbi:hypothetical protein RCF98_04600 [Thiothrix lacustris]|uniref:Uncharacterized protein n=1 Tax=Thiothrix lacustris TaxID=525917 RepID=A0ABY9MV08_9GAMM|nr:hypothetical protein [Thiothrix lacustris]WML91621.1 hypothetical protein RCF98_04600 [Thiothrix lacustris]